MVAGLQLRVVAAVVAAELCCGAVLPVRLLRSESLMECVRPGLMPPLSTLNLGNEVSDTCFVRTLHGLKPLASQHLADPPKNHITHLVLVHST